MPVSNTEDPDQMLADLRRSVHLWVAAAPDEEPSTAWVTASEAMLSDEERARHRRFVRSAERTLFLRARVLVRTTLSRYSRLSPGDWSFRRTRYGRPEIANAEACDDLRFSLSHTSGMVAVMVHDRADAGVDLERLNSVGNVHGVARFAFAAIERAELAALGPEQAEARFYRLWTLREAFLKATGRGFSLPVEDFWFAGSADEPIRLSCRESVDPDPSAWRFTVRPASSDHVLATACRAPAGRPIPEVRLFRVTLA